MNISTDSEYCESSLVGRWQSEGQSRLHLRLVVSTAAISATTKKLNYHVLFRACEDKFVILGQSESGMCLKEQASGIAWVCINDDINVLSQISCKTHLRVDKA